MCIVSNVCALVLHAYNPLQQIFWPSRASRLQPMHHPTIEQSPAMATLVRSGKVTKNLEH